MSKVKRFCLLCAKSFTLDEKEWETLLTLKKVIFPKDIKASLKWCEKCRNNYLYKARSIKDLNDYLKKQIEKDHLTTDRLKAIGIKWDTKKGKINLWKANINSEKYE